MVAAYLMLTRPILEIYIDFMFLVRFPRFFLPVLYVYIY